MTNRQLLSQISELLDEDDRLDEEADPIGIVDMGAVLHNGFTEIYSATIKTETG